MGEAFEAASGGRETGMTFTYNDTSLGANVPITFLVFGDGKQLWASKPVKAPRELQTRQVSVAGGDVLELRVTCAGAFYDAHAVWYEPQVSR
jgi:hypothetical protein